MPPDLSGQTYAVIGAGRSGVAAARFLARAGATVRLTDAGTPTVPALPGVDLFLGSHPDACFAGVDEVILSPGVPRAVPVVAGLVARGVPVIGEVELAYRHTERPLLAVTGTNGKSTTVAWLYAMLQAAGARPSLGGNIGTPLIETCFDGEPGPCVVELSSFQLESIVRFRPRIAALLNLSPDHEDRYPNAAAYGAAKARIFENQLAGDLGVVNLDDPALASLAAGRLGFSIAAAPGGAARIDGGTVFVETERFAGPLLDTGEMALTSHHDLANGLAAALMALAWGAAPAAVAGSLARFTGLAHRGEVVAERGGVRFADNSKATNVGAVETILASFADREVVLIAGGSTKGGGFDSLRPAVARACSHCLLIGETAPEIGAALASCCPVEEVGEMEAAVARAAALAHPGQTVLLAPACASFDQFANYGERGDRFAALARALPNLL